MIKNISGMIKQLPSAAAIFTGGGGKCINNTAQNVLKNAPAQDTFVLKAARKNIDKLYEPIASDEVTPELLNELVDFLHKEGEKNFNTHFNLLKDYFSETGAKLTGRIKEHSSILSKLDKRRIMFSDTDCPVIYGAIEAVPDLIGYRLVTDGSPEQSEKILKQILKLIEDGEAEASHMFNYGKIPYFSEKQIEKLKKVGFCCCPDKKLSGFSCANIYLRNKQGLKFELQVIGEKSNKVNKKQHLMYNYLNKGAATEGGVINEKMQKLFDSMSHAELEQYRKYENLCYEYARAIETGLKMPKPNLPEGFDKALTLI